MTSSVPRQPDDSAPRLEQEVRAVDGLQLQLLARAALSWLTVNHQTVNALNVFPVPDGDTGTNMLLTMQAACQEVAEGDERNVGRMAHGLAQGALMGARGNSGVILSQLWRGFSRSLDQHPLLDPPSLARALVMARDTAYQGVVRPVEGTILTVASDVARAAVQAQAEGSDLVAMLDRIVSAADASVLRTPQLLPVLREAGVVDSGGKGLFFILEGMLRSVRGLSLEEPTLTVEPLSALNLRQAEELSEPGQDYEIVVDFHPSEALDLDRFYERLQAMGTSIQVGQGDEFYRLHIHVPSENVDLPLAFVRTLGTPSKWTVENLQEQMAQRASEGGSASAAYKITPVSPGHLAAIAVAPGTGFAKVFASLGVAAVVSGGQTMNPSTQEILDAFENLPTDKVLILPNNKNIQMTAEQARELTVKQVVVIPSMTVPQGVAAMLSFSSDGDLHQVAQAMTQAMGLVESGEITLATRNVEINGVHVREGQVIGLHNGDLAVSGEDLEGTLFALLDHMSAGAGELITLYYGSDLTPDQAGLIEDHVRERFPSQQIEIVEGQQPHYPLILSVE